MDAERLTLVNRRTEFIESNWRNRMADDLSYNELVARNAGYIDPATQLAIRSCRLLIAGCGIGSSPAVCAARMGFENFVLVDGDVVDRHNLNRQFYDAVDVGRPADAGHEHRRARPAGRLHRFEPRLDLD